MTTREGRADSVAPKTFAWLAVAALMPACVGLLLFGSTGADDSYITHWVARTLAETGEMLNYNGERVEQSSSLTQVVYVAILARLSGFGVPVVSVILSVACGALTTFAAFWLARLSAVRQPLVPAFFVATSPLLVYWSFSGLETTLATLLGVLTAGCTIDYVARGGWWRLVRVGLAVASYGGVRPEVPILLLAWLAGALILIAAARSIASASEPSAEEKRLAAVCLLAALTMGGLVLFRQAYFDAPFPQPVAAKAAGLSVGAMLRGTRYVVGYAARTLDIAAGLLAIAGALLWLRRRPWHASDSTAVAHVLVLLFVLGSAGFVVVSGGDWMGVGRFLVPIVPAAAVLAASAIGRLDRRGFAAVVIALVLLQHGTSLIIVAQSRSPGTPIWTKPPIVGAGIDEATFFETRNRDYLRERLVGVWMRDNLPLRSALILTGQMGLAAYTIASAHPGVRFIDRYGLTDRTVTGCAWSAPLPRTTTGLFLTHERFFEGLGSCGWERPDVIFDLDDSRFSRQRVAEAHGYWVLYTQQGPIDNGSRWLPGLSGGSRMFVAVRDSFLPVRPAPVHIVFTPAASLGVRLEAMR